VTTASFLLGELQPDLLVDVDHTPRFNAAGSPTITVTATGWITKTTTFTFDCEFADGSDADITPMAAASAVLFR